MQGKESPEKSVTVHACLVRQVRDALDPLIKDGDVINGCDDDWKGVEGV